MFIESGFSWPKSFQTRGPRNYSKSQWNKYPKIRPHSVHRIKNGPHRSLGGDHSLSRIIRIQYGLGLTHKLTDSFLSTADCGDHATNREQRGCPGCWDMDHGSIVASHFLWG